MDVLRTGLRSGMGLPKAAALAVALASGGYVAAQSFDAGPSPSFGPPPDAAPAGGPALRHPEQVAQHELPDSLPHYHGHGATPLVKAPFRAEGFVERRAMTTGSSLSVRDTRSVSYPAAPHAHGPGEHAADFGADPNALDGGYGDAFPPPGNARSVQGRPVPVLPVPYAKAGRPPHPHGRPAGQMADRGRHRANGRPGFDDRPALPQGPIGLWISLPIGSSRNKSTDASHGPAERTGDARAVTPGPRRGKQDDADEYDEEDHHEHDEDD